MASFQLLSVDCYLLTKIINKLDEDSYFRLQQTNKIMNEFIRNNKHICVHLSESYDFKLYFEDEEREKRRNEMDVECFYGVQFAKLRPSDNFFSDNPENFKKNCDLLKKCRITCEKLDLTYPCCRPSKEEIAMLINIVKPRIASVYGMYDRVDDPDRCNALLQSGSKTLKDVHVSLDLENTATLVPQLFSTFPTVNITSRICSTEEQVKLLHTMLKILRSQSFLNLQNFSVRAFPVDEFPSSYKLWFDEVKEKFKDLNWIYTRECKYEGDDDEEQMEEEFDYLAWGCEEEDEEESEKEENEDKEKEEVEINEDTDDDEEEETTDYEDERLLYVKKKFIAILELPNGPCEIVFENDSNYTRSQLSMSLGDRERAYFY